MATIRSFEESEVWQRARKYSQRLGDIFEREKIKRDFALKDQVSRAAGSIMDNIAEGFDRGRNRELVHFLSISKGSTAETLSQLYRMLDRKYISDEEFKELQVEARVIGKMLGSLISYLKSSEMKGQKFHEPISGYETRDADSEP